MRTISEILEETKLYKGADVKVGMVTRKCEATGEYDMVTKVTPKTITVETFRKDGSQANYFRPTRIRKDKLPTIEEVLRDELRNARNRFNYLVGEFDIESKDEIEELQGTIPMVEKYLKENF